ncbi:major facilitator superfamily transporter [Natrialba aegyptia DSM 13077]|uniref:Major facilitator superfamily transporter n=1 Tax=Natrialba aegyptia DSM 13077 TaxID=1227491 RepID=M0ANR7_9EURY|nr:major facilitator superfamily transporter [Natrialba aegyptia DSM 13077]
MSTDLIKLLRSRFELFGDRDLRALAISGLVTRFGYSLTYIGITTIFVFDTEINVLQIGLLGLLLVIPNVVVSPVIGVILDRVSRRKTLIAIELLGGLTVLLPLVSMSLQTAYLVMFLIGTYTAIVIPAQRSLITSIVNDDDLSNANGFVSSAESTAELVGPAIAGALVVIIDPRLLLVADSVSYFISAVLLYRMNSYPSPSEGSDSSPISEFLDGCRHVSSSSALIGFIGVGVIVYGTLGTLDILLPFYVRDVLSGDATGLGILASVIAAGTTTGGLLVSWLSGEDERLGYAIGLLLNAGAISLLIMVPSLLIAGMSLLIAGVGSMMTITYLQTLIQQTAASEYMSRVLGTYESTIRIGQIIGVAIASMTIVATNVIIVFGAMAAILVVIGGSTILLIRFSKPHTNRSPVQ